MDPRHRIKELAASIVALVEVSYDNEDEVTLDTLDEILSEAERLLDAADEAFREADAREVEDERH
jgi:hypothetical protein